MSPFEFEPGDVLLAVDLQNDFLHPDGAYGRAGQTAPALAALPALIAPVAEQARAALVPIVATQFTLAPGRNGEPIISSHLRALRPFLARGDFEPGAWGHQPITELGAVDCLVEKVAFSAFHQTRLEWVLSGLTPTRLIVAGIVTNGGVASTVRDAHVRDLPVVVLGECCAAFDPIVHDATLTSLASIVSVRRD